MVAVMWLLWCFCVERIEPFLESYVDFALHSLLTPHNLYLLSWPVACVVASRAPPALPAPCNRISFARPQLFVDRHLPVLWLLLALISCAKFISE